MKIKSKIFPGRPMSHKTAVMDQIVKDAEVNEPFSQEFLTEFTKVAIALDCTEDELVEIINSLK